MRLRVVLAATLVCAPVARAQGMFGIPPVSYGDSSVATIMVAARGQLLTIRWLIGILRQESGPVPQPRLDSLADSLLARVLAAKVRPPTGSAARTPAGRAVQNALDNAKKALDALGQAGESGMHGRPYARTLDLLTRIHRESPLVALRDQALALMPAMSDGSRAVAYLEEVAGSADTTAWTAMSVLVATANGSSGAPVSPTPAEQAAAAAALKDLYARHAVKGGYALQLLWGWIGTNCRDAGCPAH